jgi:4-hydroxymandelate oxidase
MELLRRLEDRARVELPEAVYDYFAGGAGDEQTMRENVEAWQHLWLRPRQLTGLAQADTSIELLGRRLSAPLILAPAAAQRLLNADGELASGRAAAAAGVAFALSTRATADLAEVAQAAGPEAALWFQLYIEQDRDMAAVLRRAGEQGYEQVVLTVDVPIAGRRERELRHGEIPLPEGVGVATHLGEPTAALAKPLTGGWRVPRWQDIAWAAEASGLPVMVKGIVTAEDARQALAYGASAVIVSNHGARQLDGCVPTAVALREVAAAVAGAVPVLVDGGIRSGADIVRALACGADAVLIGRPYLWGLACDGEAGVRSVIDALVEDLARTLVLIGADNCAAVTPAHVRARSWD